MTPVDSMRRTITWLKQVAKWLARLRIVAVAFAPVFATFIYLLLFSWTEPHIRWAGLGLQLAGVLSVACGVASTRKQFGHPSTIDRAMTFIREWPRYRYCSQPPSGWRDVRHRYGTGRHGTRTTRRGTPRCP